MKKVGSSNSAIEGWNVRDGMPGSLQKQLSGICFIFAIVFAHRFADIGRGWTLEPHHAPPTATQSSSLSTDVELFGQPEIL